MGKVFMSSDREDCELLVKMPTGHILAKSNPLARDPHMVIECNGKEIMKFVSDGGNSIKVTFSDGLYDSNKRIHYDMEDNKWHVINKEEK